MDHAHKCVSELGQERQVRDGCKEGKPFRQTSATPKKVRSGAAIRCHSKIRHTITSRPRISLGMLWVGEGDVGLCPIFRPPLFRNACGPSRALCGVARFPLRLADSRADVHPVPVSCRHVAPRRPYHRRGMPPYDTQAEPGTGI